MYIYRKVIRKLYCCTFKLHCRYAEVESAVQKAMSTAGQNQRESDRVYIHKGKSLPAIGGHGEKFPYTSSIFSVYVVVENVWTPLSASFSRLLQR